MQRNAFCKQNSSEYDPEKIERSWQDWRTTFRIVTFVKSRKLLYFNGTVFQIRNCDKRTQDIKLKKLYYSLVSTGTKYLKRDAASP